MVALTNMAYTHYASPLGPLLLAADANGLRHIEFRSALANKPTAQAAQTPLHWQQDPLPFVDITRQLDAYFAGENPVFDMPLAPAGTEFQQVVWQALQTVPYGTTTHYGAIARHIGKPTASRAVGAANGRNPIPIIIPCHRIIGANGSLTGFSGGLAIKQWLLAHERGERTLF